MSETHLSLESISSLVDGELDPTVEQGTLQHLDECHACALQVLQAHQLKTATQRAATGRFIASPDALKRMSAGVLEPVPQRTNVLPMRLIVWTSIAALLLVMLSLGAWQRTRRANAVGTELLDQHLALLSESSIPQVISSDKHTVKPWFQGKLPFTFNLPEPTQLPANTSLVGADLAYMDAKPAALLLFKIQTHKVSIFVTQADHIPRAHRTWVRSGFNLDESSAQGLEFFAVSDVNRADLNAPLQALMKAQ